MRKRLNLDTPNHSHLSSPDCLPKVAKSRHFFTPKLVPISANLFTHKLLTITDN